MQKIAKVIIPIFLMFSTLFAQWAVQAGGTFADRGSGIAVDGSGNSYVTGYFEGTADFDPGAGTANLTSTGNRDVYIAKYDASGNYVWAIGMGGTSADIGSGIAVDGSGNNYVTGYFQGTVDFDPGAGTANLTSAGSGDVYIAKYDASGNYVWVIGMGGISEDRGRGIAVDGSGNSYVTGYFQGTADFDPGAGTANLTSTGNRDVYIAKYDASGNYVWAVQAGGTSSDNGYGITVDGSGNSYITGYFQGTADFDPGAGTVNLTSVGNNDIFIAKYDGSGNYVWAVQAGGTSSDNGYGITVDGSGNSYVTGDFYGTVDFDPGAGTVNLTSAGSGDVYIAKYDGSGNYVWAIGMGGTSYERGSGIAVDGSGNNYVAGYFFGTADFDPGAGTANLSSAGAYDIFIAKYDESGNYVWVKGMGGTSNDRGYGMTVDGSGNSHVTGNFLGTADFDPGAGTANLTSAGDTDLFVAKYNANGTLDLLPEINLKQSTTNIADGGSYDYGSKALGTDTDIVFTIENTGTADLTLTTPLSIGGTDASQFSIASQPGSSTISASGSTTFTVRFSPTSTGAKTASISIANNDSNENPYDLTLNGTGIYNTDYGDAPSSFGSSGHTYNPDLYLGTGVTGDASDYGSGTASGDVDDGVVSFETWVNGTVVGPGYLPDGTIGSVTMDDDTYAVLVQATNNTGTAAQLVGWIDWNRNNVFDDPSERSVTVLDGVTGNVPDGSDNVDVVIYWDGQTQDGTASFARFRITTDASFKSSSSPTPTGNVGSGEVEDYQIGEGSLPVELTSFLVENTIEGVLCSWNTESEFENLGFILERRISNGTWQEIASYKTDEVLMGKGTTSIPTDYEYVDKLVEPNTTYEYRLADVAYDGIVTYHATRTITVEQKPLSSTIESFTVLPAYPNPFNPTTTITYGLDTNSEVTIQIYDISGKLITTLLNTEQQQGWHTIEWNGTDHNFNQVPAGIYLSRITSNNTTKTAKLMLLR